MNCPNCGEVHENNAVWVTSFPANETDEEEGVNVCPECNHILEERE